MTSPDAAFVEIGVIGGGVTALAAGHLLARQRDVRVTLLEASAQFGGRAGVTDGAEHCTRFFLNDYSYLFALLGEVSDVEERPVLEALRPVQRVVRLGDGNLVGVSHAYPSQATEIRMRDRLRLARATWSSYLIARQSAGNSNTFGHLYNYALLELVTLLRNMLSTEQASALPGSTYSGFVEPWLNHLRSSGVQVRAEHRVDRLQHDAAGVWLEGDRFRCRFDAVVVATAATDAFALLDASNLPRPLDWRSHAHCLCVTVLLDPREPLLADPGPRAVSITGALVLVQPAAHRCVVLVTTLPSTDVDDVVAWLRSQLKLEHDVRDVRVKLNHRPSDSVYVGSGLDPEPLESDPVQPAGPARVFFAGSYLRNTYVVDSAEGACRSAYSAVERLIAHHPSRFDRSAHRTWRHEHGLPAAGRSRPVARHPNATPAGRSPRVLWELATVISTVVTKAVSRSTSYVGAARTNGGAVVYLMRGDDAFGGFLAMRVLRRLNSRPRAVLPEETFDGFGGRLLAALGALPAHHDLHAMVVTLVSAVRGGDSLVFTAPTHEALAVAVSRATGRPVIPIAGAAAPRQSWWPRVKRPPAVVVAGAPVQCDGESPAVDGTRLQAALDELQARALAELGREQPRS